MAYTLNQGVEAGGMDRIQRSLLVGLPVLILVLTAGALLHRGNRNGQAAGTKTIPIVSTLKTSSQHSGANSSDASSKGIAADTAAPSAGSSSLDSGLVSSTGGSGGTSSAGTSSGGTSGVVGGRGGGPAGGSGGTSGGTSTGGTGTSGGGVAIPNCSLNQVATVNCMVPACSPAVSLAPGQKAILGVGNTCIVLN
jgi:hypothetical protein